MGTAIAVLSRFETNDWNAELYAAISLAYRLASLIKDRSKVVKLAYHFRRLESILSNLFVEVRKAIDHPLSHGPDTPEKVREASDLLWKLHAMIDRIYKASKRSGLTNNSLTAGHLRKIQEWNEEVMELAEVLELILDKDALESLYRRAAQEKARGEVFDLSRVE